MKSEQELDRLLAQGSELYAQRLSERLTGGERAFSPGFEAAMKETIASQAEKARRGKTVDWTRQLRAAGLVLVCLIGLGAGAMRVEAIRLPLLGFFAGERESYTQVEFPSLEDNDTFGGQIQDYLPTWLPEGYRLESVDEDSRFIHGLFVREDEEEETRLFLTATPRGGSSVLLDRQGAEVTQTEIGTRGAFIAKRTSDQRVIVLMFDNRYVYTLTSYLAPEDAVAIMESIPGAG